MVNEKLKEMYCFVLKINCLSFGNNLTRKNASSQLQFIVRKHVRIRSYSNINCKIYVRITPVTNDSAVFCCTFIKISVQLVFFGGKLPSPPRQGGDGSTIVLLLCCCCCNHCSGVFATIDKACIGPLFDNSSANIVLTKRCRPTNVGTLSKTGVTMTTLK